MDLTDSHQAQHHTTMLIYCPADGGHLLGSLGSGESVLHEPNVEVGNLFWDEYTVETTIIIIIIIIIITATNEYVYIRVPSTPIMCHPAIS